MKADPVVHFEMPAKNKKRVAKFYTSAFGWQMTQLGKDMGDYLLAGTTPVDKNNMATEPGAINGGFYDYGKGGKVPHLVISIKNLRASMTKVKKAGGRVLGKPLDIPGIGTFVMLSDTEGNRIGMLEPAPMGK